MDVRFPRNEIIRRVEAIAQHATKVTVTNLDAEEYISDYLPRLPKETFVYLDPPYFHQGSRLYLNHYQPNDHARLAKVIQSKLRRPWIVSYDAVPQVAKCYGQRRALRYDLQYTAADAYVGREVIFFSDQLNLPRRSVHEGIDCALLRRPKSLSRV
jgi:DNA adenine methylase